eukprot:1161740-Pelagomonas_calceolata.AAC.6
MDTHLFSGPWNFTEWQAPHLAADKRLCRGRPAGRSPKHIDIQADDPSSLPSSSMRTNPSHHIFFIKKASVFHVPSCPLPGAAAALAASSIVFRNSDPVFAEEALHHASYL